MNTNDAIRIAEESYDVAMECWERGQVIPGTIDKPITSWPKLYLGVMTMAFSCEVSIKTKLQVYDKIHDLNKLFNTLPEDIQNWVIDETVSILDPYSFCWNEESFRNLLVEASNNFQQARYCFEETPFMVTPLFLDTLARLLLKMHDIDRPFKWAKPIKLWEKES